MNSIQNKISLLFPTIAIIGFLVLYVISTYFYPGGSYHDRSASGFSWMYNYWCNLMEIEALNGEKNDARLIAITGTAILCIGIGYFYFLFPRYFEMRKLWRMAIRIVGMTSMIFAVFLFTSYHDTVLNIAGIFGFIAFIGTLIALRRSNFFFILWLGVFSILLIGLNNYIYYSHIYIEYLPLIQKITMTIVLTWMIAVNLVFIRSSRQTNKV